MKMAVSREGRLRRYLTQKQIADALGISVQTVRSLISRHEMTAVAIAGHTLRVPEEELERFLQNRRIGRPFLPNTHPQRSEQPL